MIKEAYDDFLRYQRDKVLNLKNYTKLDAETHLPTVVQAQNFRVGDIIYVQSGERIPADLILLYTTDKSGTVFIKTDQLDGETDWKVRRPITFTQNSLEKPEDLVLMESAEIKCEGPTNLIYEFNGIFTSNENNHDIREALSLENTLWAETILASQGFIMGLVVYTGRQTRS